MAKAKGGGNRQGRGNPIDFSFGSVGGNLVNQVISRARRRGEGARDLLDMARSGNSTMNPAVLREAARRMRRGG